MKRTTGGRGREVAGQRTTDGRRIACDRTGFRPPSFVLCLLLPALCLLVLLSGCDQKALEQAQREAREAKVAVQQLKHNLGLAEKEIVNIQAQLNAVRQSRDELQQQIERTNQERDQAMEFAQKAQEALTAQSSGQLSATAALQKQVAELNALVAAQQKELDQLRKDAATVEPTPVVPQPQGQTPPPTEPNEGQ